MELIGERVMLRTPDEADAVAVGAAVQRSLAELRPWMPWATATYGTDEALGWIRGDFGDAHRFVMVDHERSEIVGSCGLNRVDELNSSANLGYWVRTDRAGAGFATDATRELARFGLDEAGYHRLEISMSTRNHASRRVAEKAGATFEGTARGALRLLGEFHDAHRFSFVAGDAVI